ncbi:uncharacterized protein MELLADRAFT_115563 [Melampsora larici-populina 98AG31]|uniref:Major facilitator superfamily (MFS) profile domain-containing protein n=1 Tax=Melampsora larici-populina (strain 98AG31 / pathotype 3-4-7) TaxID=747676 RepID=F4RBM0_MELLP|nr:uncharacterized protein MELLADRAFT_115563 [Melampsora larici-populina 98AG31]EGG10311.1 hypothetical protein MELLADRAFT_115563 [Melampsora larici-populina 98AG31]
MTLHRASLPHFPSSTPARLRSSASYDHHSNHKELKPASHSTPLESTPLLAHQDTTTTPQNMSPLDQTLEKVGMGLYQWKLLVLCGFGWMCDNMWLQSVAVILPRVQIHFRVSDRWIGLLSTSIFTGMMVGAWTWGNFSDSYGRRHPFNGTLLMTSVFGLLCGFSPSFEVLCFLLFCLGTGVGGSMPTDGMLFLENIPKTRHYLLTALSFFFSIGAVIASVLGLVFLPGQSCHEPAPNETLLCNPELENRGWRHLLIALGVITFILFGCRVILFKLQESPKYLMATGRTADAIIVLEIISQHNGDSLQLSPADVEDDQEDYDDVMQSQRQRRAGYTALAETTNGASNSVWDVMKSSLDDFTGRIEYLFTPHWRLTTILVWTIWTTVAFGYTCFNVFLPKYLEKRIGMGGDGLEKTLRDYVLYTVAGCPGSILGAWLIETRLGRKYSMVLSTFLTAIGTLVFITVRTEKGVIMSSMAISLAATLMYAVIYGYTPEVFTPPMIRGTACGIASALSRLAGILAPMIAGIMMITSIYLPMYLSVCMFLISCACMLFLPVETRQQSTTRTHSPA